MWPAEPRHLSEQDFIQASWFVHVVQINYVPIHGWIRLHLEKETYAIHAARSCGACLTVAALNL